MRVIANGPLAAVGSAMPVKIAKGIIAAYPVPFGRPGPLSVPSPLLHLGQTSTALNQTPLNL